MSKEVCSDPLVSVLMVVRNEALSVTDAINSVRQQSHERWELLVLDGDSTDATADVVRDISRQDSRVRLLRNPGRVIPTGLNVGLRAALGTYIARLDGHSSWNETYLAHAIVDLTARPDAAGVGGRRFGVAGSATGRAIALALSSPLGVGNSVYHYGEQPQDTDHATNGVYRAGPVRSVGGWDEALLVNEDVDFDYRLQQAGFALLYDPRLTTAWKVRESIPDFFRQYRRYGRGKAAMVRKNGARAMRARHLGAPGLVLALSGSVLAGCAGRRVPATLVPAVYVSAVAVGSIRLVKADPAHPGLTRPLAMALVAMHIGWGIGFIEGILLRRSPAAASQDERGVVELATHNE